MIKLLKHVFIVFSLIIPPIAHPLPLKVQLSPSQWEAFQDKLNRYTVGFYVEAAKRGVPLPYPGALAVVFEFPEYPGMRGELLGYCHTEINMVALSPSVTRFTDLEIKAIIFHELFHCAGDLPHSAGGIMDPHNTDVDVMELAMWLDQAFSRVGKVSLRQIVENKER